MKSQSEPVLYNAFRQLPQTTERIETKYRRIVTPIPAPDSLDTLQRAAELFPGVNCYQPPVVWDRADGFQVFDANGNCWIDFTSTAVAANTGHGHPAIRAAERHDYEAFARQELPHRAQFGYPPFGAMIRVIIRGDDASQCEQTADQLAKFLRDQLVDQDAIRVLGAAPAPMPRLRRKFRFHLILQGPNLDQLRASIREARRALRVPEEVQWMADVDPWEML